MTLKPRELVIARAALQQAISWNEAVIALNRPTALAPATPAIRTILRDARRSIERITRLERKLAHMHVALAGRRAR